MEFYAVFGLDQAPRKLRSVGVSSDFYCYFPPPLPEVVVIFGVRSCKDAMEESMHVQLHLDSETDSVCRVLGEISRDKPAMCFDGNWKAEERLIAKEIQEKGRLIKLKVSPKFQTFDENYKPSSQDSGISDFPSVGEMKSEHENFKTENTPKGIKNLIKERKNSSWTSPLAEKNQTIKKGTSVKRKSMFEFEDEDDNAKFIKTEIKTPSNLVEECKISKSSPKDSATPKSSKTKKINKFFTPRSSKGVCKNILIGKGSPVTPGLMELEAPTARWGHTMCLTEGQTAFLVGGQGLKHQMCKDSLWQYDFSNKSWTRHKDESNGASRRMGHTAVYSEKLRQVFVFGGSKNRKWYNDVHTLDIETLTWKSLKVTGKAPVRAYHSCTLSDEELLIFGGVFPNPDPIPDGCSNDVHFFNTVSNSWYQPIVSGDKPRARSGHSACLVQGKLFIFGGWDAPACFNDLWTLDIGFMNFKLAKTSGETPSPRSWHGSTLSSDSQSIFIHGGYNGAKALCDVYMLRLTSMSWTNLSNGHLDARAGHILMNVAASQNSKKQEDRVFIVCGGNNAGRFFSDISELPTEC